MVKGKGLGMGTCMSLGAWIATGTGPGHDFGSFELALSIRCCCSQSSACSSCLLVLCCAHFLKIFIGFHLSDCQSVIGHPPVTSR